MLFQSTILSSFEAIAGIFKTGMGFGVVMVITVILVILFIVMKPGKKIINNDDDQRKNNLNSTTTKGTKPKYEQHNADTPSSHER